MILVDITLQVRSNAIEFGNSTPRLVSQFLYTSTSGGTHAHPTVRLANQQGFEIERRVDATGGEGRQFQYDSNNRDFKQRIAERTREVLKLRTPKSIITVSSDGDKALKKD